jgi:uncharacterized protein (DUF2336 family)
MAMSATAQVLLEDLDTRLRRATESWRSAALRQVLDLFLAGAETYTREQVALFGEVIGRLIANLDRGSLVELSERLSPAANAPLKVVGALARHPDSAVYGPAMAQAKGLPEKDLAEAADRDRIDLKVLAKIAARPQLGEVVTDVLLKRGNRAIQKVVIGNAAAKISENGFARVIMGLKGDKELAAAIAARSDVPSELRVWLTAELSK